MKKLIIILLISNLAFSQNAILDTNEILIGKQTKFTITNPLETTKSWPSYNKFLVEGIEIIEKSKIDTTNKILSQQFIITAWDSGSYYIPSIIFSENSKTKEVLIKVRSVTIENAKLKDIKGPIKEPIGWSDIWPWILGLLVICLIIYLLKKYMFTKKERVKKTKPKIIIPPDVTALRQLTKLEKAKMWQEGNIKEYHSQLSEIIRRYTEDRYKFIALELTTEEILNELQSKIKIEQLNNLKILLERADLAKFAKSKPIDTENTESMLLAKKFVKTTKKTNKNG